MAKRKRTTRATNKIAGSLEGSLIQPDEQPEKEAPAMVDRTYAVALARSRVFSAEFEAVIEIIARERVYRQMLAGMGRRLIVGPAQATSEFPASR